MLQWNVAPALTVAEVDDLLAQARRADSAGVEPNEAGYTPTWTTASLKAAAAEGWRWKAQKVAAQYDVALGDGVSAQRSQQYQHCLTMAREYSRSGGFGSLLISRSAVP